MADTVKQIGIKQADGTYTMKDIGVDASNVDGLSSASVGSATTATKATGDKNAKDITTYVASISKNGANIRTTNGAGTNTDVDFTMGAASASAAGSAGFVPAPAKGKQGQYLRGDGTWNTPTDTTYSGSNNVSITNKVIDLTASGATAGSYGPSANVTGSNGATLSVPYVTVDAKGRVTSISNKTYTSVDTQYSNPSGNSTITINNTNKTLALGAHASTGTSYGKGDASNYGHVKLSDTYATAVSGGNAAGGIGASQNALYNATHFTPITYTEWLKKTQAQRETGKWYVTGVPALTPAASGVTYSNTTSGLSATTVQGAIDELNSSLILHNHREYGYIETTYGNVFVVKDTLNKIVTINGILSGIPNNAWTEICRGIPVPAINYYSAQNQFFVALDGSGSNYVSMFISDTGILRFYGRNSLNTACFSYTYLAL